jgi:hypothetical protein
MTDLEDEPNAGAEAGAAAGWARPLKRALGLFLVLFAGLAALYLLVGYFAWQRGATVRVAVEATRQVEQVDRQVRLARANIEQGSYNLALRRLEWVLAQSPSDPRAATLRVAALAALNLTLTPGAQVTLPPTPAVEPAPTPGQILDPANDLQRLRRLAARRDWQPLLEGTLAFQRQFPSYERLATDGLLYQAYLNLGLTYVDSSRIELGLYYLAQAERLGDLPQEALDYRAWARLYLQGIAFYGANWAAAGNYFRELCLAAPFYQGACALLREALEAHADQLAAAQDWCPAEALYREALRQGRAPALQEKLTTAVEGCALATPTPGPITNTLPLTDTGSFEFDRDFVP